MLPIILGMMSDPSSAVRSHAVSGLRAFATPDVVPHLIQALQDEDRKVREQARRLLKRWSLLVSKNRRPSLVSKIKSELMKVLEAGPPCGRVAAALAVDDLGQGAAKVLPALQRNLQHGDSRVRMAAALVIGRIPSEPDRVSCPAVERGSSRCELIEEDIDALVQLGPDVDTIVRRLANDLNSIRLRQRSVRLLELLGHVARPALPHLIRLLKNPDLNDCVLIFDTSKSQPVATE